MTARWKAVSHIDHLAEGLLIFEGGVLAARRLHIRSARRLPLVSEVVWATRRHRFGWIIPAAIVCWLAGHFAFGGRS